MKNAKSVVLVIMDGVGIGAGGEGDAVKRAYTPTLDMLTATCPNTKLKAHGTAVGLPTDDDMGNSEVGHNALGCGQIYSQGAKLVNESIENGKIYHSETWQKLISGCTANGSKLHFIGLLSDGNVHSNIAHLDSMLAQAKQDGVKTARVHILLDGRDVPATSALQYVDALEAHLATLSDTSYDARIASGGGRMKITMDRYQADWDMVKAGWETHVCGKGRQFATAREAIETYRNELGVIDQDLPAFVIAKNGAPVGTIDDGDSVILFNFRGDRAIEISMAFDAPDFRYFKKEKNPKVLYAGMLEYDGDLKLPARYLVNPPHITHTLSELLVAHGVKQYAVSETQKYGHVTYFWNGNRSGKTSEELEIFEEIHSDPGDFDRRPWMKSADITDKIIAAIESGKYGFIRANFPNGDMVGHTGIYQAVICSMEGMDIQLGRIHKAAEEAGAVLLITADHGNSDDMYEHDKKTGAVSLKADGTPKAKTSHSLNPVPCIIFDPAYQGEYERDNHEKALKEGLGISSIAATCMELLGFKAPDDYDPSVLKFFK